MDNEGLGRMLRRLLLVILLLTAPALYSHARNSAKKAVSSHRTHRRYVKNTLSFFPTAGSLLAQNQEADRIGLPRVRDKAGLIDQVHDGVLVTIPVGPALRAQMPLWRAYLRPWAADRLADIAKTFYGAFGKPLTVDSAVRPLDVQRRLWCSRMVPAAPPTGPTASVHPAGIAFDIGKRTLTKNQQNWLRLHLFYWQSIGWIIVEEEHGCFHVVAIFLSHP